LFPCKFHHKTNLQGYHLKLINFAVHIDKLQGDLTRCNNKFFPFFVSLIHMSSENFLIKKLEERKNANAYRQLRLPEAGKADFCSNDYLGIVRNNLLAARLNGHEYKTGSTGSRLLAGNYALIEEVEKEIALFHDAPAALIFNSGFDANLGLLGSVPQKGDTVIYDALSHASLRDGIRLSAATAYAFRHNDLEDLEKKAGIATGNIFIVTESVFSMDGDKAPLEGMAAICARFGASLIVDEAHATGVVGDRGEGLVQKLGLQEQCFARIHTFGKACGAHGAAIAGSGLLRNYLVNFCRPFIYSTALPEAGVAAIRASYKTFPLLNRERNQLSALITQFQASSIPYKVLPGDTPVQIVIVQGNAAVKKVSDHLQQHNLDVRPILYPSVPKGEERLRIVLHSFNTEEDVSRLVQCLM
jgi:8-amino-7-oxononanoate synthase